MRIVRDDVEVEISDAEAIELLQSVIREQGERIDRLEHTVVQAARELARAIAPKKTLQEFLIERWERT